MKNYFWLQIFWNRSLLSVFFFSFKNLLVSSIFFLIQIWYWMIMVFFSMKSYSKSMFAREFINWGQNLFGDNPFSLLSIAITIKSRINNNNNTITIKLRTHPKSKHLLNFKIKKKLFPLFSWKKSVNNLLSYRKPLKCKFGLDRWQGINNFLI